MKEKISRYTDGEGNKEEMEKLFKENKEAKEYFDELKEMKNVLSEMKVNAPPNIEKNVLQKVWKKRKRFAYALISFAAVFLVSLLFLKVEVLNINNSIPTYRVAPQKNLELHQAPKESTTPSKGFDITVSKDEENKIVEILKQYGIVKKQNGNIFIYTLDVKKLPEVLNKLKETAKVTNINVKGKKGPVTIKVKINAE